jgi:hypothetical protein
MDPKKAALRKRTGGTGGIGSLCLSGYRYIHIQSTIAVNADPISCQSLSLDLPTQARDSPDDMT